MKNISYMNMVDSLRYVADCTRSDVAYTTDQLVKYYISAPGHFKLSTKAEKLALNGDFLEQGQKNHAG